MKNYLLPLALISAFVMSAYGGSNSPALFGQTENLTIGTPTLTTTRQNVLNIASNKTFGGVPFCFLINRVAAAGMLRDYSDKQIENGLCMTSIEVVWAIGTDDSFKEDVCGQAAQYMMIEFNKRFPGRSPNEVIGKC
ncbi:MAG: hypothetical protein HY280_06055 [Nitrospinae bacterium]|nr:hypothetical protein [Nitrospinota bacterium]